MYKILFLFFFLLSFQFALSPVSGVDLAVSRVISLCIGIFFVFGRFRTGSWLFPARAALFSMMGFFFVAGLSLFWAEEPIWSVRKLLFLLSFLPIWFVVTDMLYREREQAMRIFARGFFFGSVAMASISILQFLAQFVFSLDRVMAIWLTGVYPIFLGEAFSQSVAMHSSLLVNIGGETILRAVGVFPDPHVAAFYFGMAIPFGIWFAFMAKQENRFVFVFGSIILFVADLCTFSRGGYVGLLAMAGFFGAFVLYRHHERRSGTWMKKAFFGMMIVFLLGVSVPPVRERLADTFSLREGSNSARIFLWKEAAERISERPWLGYGLGNYPLAVKPSANYREPIYIHNTYLDIWAELGMIGLFFFLLAFLLPVCRFFFRGNFSDEALPAVLAMTVFLGHSMFENILFSVHIFPILLLLAAIIACYPQSKQ